MLTLVEEFLACEELGDVLPGDDLRPTSLRQPRQPRPGHRFSSGRVDNLLMSTFAPPAPENPRRSKALVDMRWLTTLRREIGPRPGGDGTEASSLRWRIDGWEEPAPDQVLILRRPFAS